MKQQHHKNSLKFFMSYSDKNRIITERFFFEEKIIQLMKYTKKL